MKERESRNRVHHASDFSCAIRWDFFIYGAHSLSSKKETLANSPFRATIKQNRRILTIRLFL